MTVASAAPLAAIAVAVALDEAGDDRLVGSAGPAAEQAGKQRRIRV